MKNPQPAAQAAAGPWSNAALAARLIVGGVFIYSGLHKAIHPAEEFAAVIESYYILTPPNALIAAKLIPWIELIAGAFLAAGYLTRAAAGVCGSLLAGFIWALLSTITRGVPLENCGCFGKSIHLTPPQAMTMDAALLLLAILAFKHGQRLMSLDNWVEQGG